MPLNPDASAGFEYRNPDIEKILREIGKSIGNKITPSGYGFALILAKYGEDGGTFYISNIDRESMMNLITEMLIRFQGEQK